MVTWWDRIGALGSAFSGATLIWLVLEASQKRWTHRKKARREQASRVFAWVDIDPDGSADPTEGEARRGSWYVIRNASDLPVTEVVMYTPAVVQHGDELIRDYGNFAVGLLPPGGERREEMPALVARSTFWSEPMCAWFTDAAGIRWFRDWNGELHEWERNKRRLDAELEAHLQQRRATVVKLKDLPE